MTLSCIILEAHQSNGSLYPWEEVVSIITETERMLRVEFLPETILSADKEARERFLNPALPASAGEAEDDECLYPARLKRLTTRENAIAKLLAARAAIALAGGVA